MTLALTAQTVIDYVRGVPELAARLNDERLTSEAITEGNVNLIFRVAAAHDPLNHSVIVKQALPHAWRYPDFNMPVERQRIELDALAIEARYSPEHVTAVYYYDSTRHIVVLEDLNQHLMMRDGLIRQQRYPNVAEHIGTFMARSLFFTSDLHLPSAEKKALVARFHNPVMCKVQEDLVFTQPFGDHPNNRWTSLLADEVAAIHADDTLRAEVFTLKERYLTHAQALLHNDLHTGSIMLNEQETRVIDPEFAFVGPIGHDVGSYLANLVISYASQEYHAPNSAERATYRAWLLDTLRNTWLTFEREFQWLWEEQGNDEWPSPTFRAQYLRRLLHDTAGFGATEIFRRTIGMAHVQDFWTIENQEARAAAEQIALSAARRWLLERHVYQSVDDLVGAVRPM